MKFAILVLLLGVVCGRVHKECISVLTFNTALSPRVKDLDIRREKLPLALKALNPDFICLQEVWLERDVRNIIDKLQRRYKQHYSAIHYDIGELDCPENNKSMEKCTKSAACDDRDVKYFTETLIPCATQQGCMELMTVSSASALQCIATKCQNELMNDTFSIECVSCAYLTSPSNTLSLDACSGEGHKRLNKGGLLVLSKKELSRALYSEFFKRRQLISPRGYITVVTASSNFRISCTQLNRIDVPFFEYGLEWRYSFETVQNNEMTMLFTYHKLIHSFVLGDFNAGPRVISADLEKNLHGESTVNYEKLDTDGYITPYMTENGLCTVCSTNPLARKNYNNVLDHIIVHKNFTFLNITSLKRVLDKEELSDHHGVQANLCRSWQFK